MIPTTMILDFLPAVSLYVHGSYTVVGASPVLVPSSDRNRPQKSRKITLVFEWVDFSAGMCFFWGLSKNQQEIPLLPRNFCPRRI